MSPPGRIVPGPGRIIPGPPGHITPGLSCLNNPCAPSRLHLLAASLTRRKFVLSFFCIAALILFWSNGKSANEIEQRQRELEEQKSKLTPPPLQAHSGYLGRTVENVCEFPNFVLAQDANGVIRKSGGGLVEPDYNWFDSDDPTARARVGPNPQIQGSANYTVIYNFASPKPPPSPSSAEDEKEDEKDGNNYSANLDDDDDKEKEEEEEQVTVIDESHLTLATHATPASLYPALIELLNHWKSTKKSSSSSSSLHPVSVSVYAPGDDFCTAAAIISWLWTCKKQIRNQVSFHVFFPSDFANDIASKTASDGIRILDVNCSVTPSIREEKSYRSKRGLPYPINTARNVARTGSSTNHFLTADISFRTSPDLADKFISFVEESKESEKLEADKTRSPIVYVVPAFSVDITATIPRTKSDLSESYADGKSVLLDRFSCAHCHKFPGLKKWLKEEGEERENGIFTVASRHHPFHDWEPLFIGNQELPLYDERLYWEGLKTRVSLLHELCLSGYRFAVLDSSFVVRSEKDVAKNKRKRKKKIDVAQWRAPFVRKNSAAQSDIIRELSTKYGAAENRKKCKEPQV